jgi:hypothetical protein
VRRALTLAVGLLALALAPAAGARGCTKTLAPPGLSAVSEYVETIPTPCGALPTGTVTPGGGASTIPSAAARTLARSGPDGTAVRSLVAATGPGATTARAHGGSVHGHRRRSGAAGPGAGGGEAGGGGGVGGSGSPLAAVLKALSGTGPGSGAGLGAALPAILLAGAVAAVALLLARRRRRPS